MLTLVADADAIIARTDPSDPHHVKATEILNSLTEIQARLLYPVTAIAESNAYIQRVLGSTATAYETAHLIISESDVTEVTEKTMKLAMKYFSPTTSKKNTLFDCIVAAVAEENNADAIFSFDKFYKSKGFKLASELEK